jgi:Tfp pilus assembly protein PilF
MMNRTIGVLLTALFALATPTAHAQTPCPGAEKPTGTATACGKKLAPSFVKRGDAYMAKKPYPWVQDAIINYGVAIGYDPQNVTAYLGLAKAHQSIRNYASAFSYYQTALAIDPNNSEAAAEVTKLIERVD